jgi:4-amino-4-deoxy-L-arabinose transferase-like glycosyltransferase
MIPPDPSQRGPIARFGPAALLVLATMLRLAVAAWMPLSADEAYYRVWSKALAPGYLDHPPMVALWIRLGTMLAGDTPLGIRLLGPLAALLGTLLLVRAARDLCGAPAATDSGADPGHVAGWMLNGTLVLNAGCVIMTPDTPLLLFWTACLAAVARLVRTGNGGWWLAAGLAAGLALDCKYTAALLAPSLLIWVLAVPAARKWLLAWQFYAGALIALAVFAPVLAWNAAHHWASFARQGGRSGDFHPGQAAQFLAELVAGQVGLATPLLFVVLCAGVARCLRRGAWREPGRGLAACVTIVPALVFVQHGLGDRVQANWPSVLYPGAALAVALTMALTIALTMQQTVALTMEQTMALTVAPPLARLRRAAVALGVLISGLLYVQAVAAPFALPRRLDFTLIRLAGWQELAQAADRARVASGGGFVAADEYGLASELAFHLDGPVLGVEARWGLFNLPPAGTVLGAGPAHDGKTAPGAAPGSAAETAKLTGILVRSDRRAGPPDPAIWPGAVRSGTAARGRGGIVAEHYTFYRVNFPRQGGAVVLPSRLGTP